MPRPELPFYPAQLSPTWTRALWRVNQWLFLRHLRIQVSLPPADLARLQALPAQGAMIIASNHPSYPDPLVLFELCRRWDRPAYFVAARILFRRLWGFEGALISRAGAFSVAPGGRNQAAVDYARDRLRDGTHPLIIFPEGHTFYLNDIIMPLKPGAADWALELAREGRPACVVPIAIKYHYQQDVRGALNRGTQRMERLVLHGAPELPPGDFWSRLYLRLYRIGDTVLSRYEERYGYRPPRGADVDERLVGLADFLIRDLERKYEREA
ncbi:MAG TPA: lysophospholipid acyltransferase family protein, partial [Candidatus Xenobia bacterium]